MLGSKDFTACVPSTAAIPVQSAVQDKVGESSKLENDTDTIVSSLGAFPMILGGFRWRKEPYRAVNTPSGALKRSLLVPSAPVRDYRH